MTSSVFANFFANSEHIKLGLTPAAQLSISLEKISCIAPPHLIKDIVLRDEEREAKKNHPVGFETTALLYTCMLVVYSCATATALTQHTQQVQNDEKFTPAQLCC